MATAARLADPGGFGFFLEYDRGTERAREYAAKLATYYRYRNSGAFKRDYQTFPILLVVSTSATAEARFAHQAYLAQDGSGGTPLLMFLTSTGRIEDCADGVLGPVWRSPTAMWGDEPRRMCWMPRLPGQVTPSAH